MRPWAVWLIVLVLLFFVSRLKVSVFLAYCKNTFSWKLKIGGISVRFRERETDEEPRAVKGTSKKKTGSRGKKIKAWAQAALEHWSEIFELIGRVLTDPALDVLKLQIAVGDDDPVKAALLYGRVCAIVSGLLPVVENTFVVHKRLVDIRCVFEKEKNDVSAEAAITLRIHEIIVLAVALLRLVIVLHSKAKSNYESGAVS